MRRRLLASIALAAFLAGLGAVLDRASKGYALGVFALTHLVGFGATAAAGGGPATVSYRATVDTGNSYNSAGPKTFSGVDIGTASSDRIVIVGFNGIPPASGRAVSAVTIAGVAAASCCTGFSDGERVLEFWAAAVPTGATGDIVVTYNNTMFNIAASVWATTGVTSAAATAAGSSSADPGSVSLDISAGGIALGIGGQATNGPSAAWTNLTEDFDTTVGGVRTVTGASAAFAAAQTALALSCDWTPPANNRVLCAAFR